jgi:hypothetical protein
MINPEGVAQVVNLGAGNRWNPFRVRSTGGIVTQGSPKAGNPGLWGCNACSVDARRSAPLGTTKYAKYTKTDKRKKF